MHDNVYVVTYMLKIECHVIIAEPTQFSICIITVVGWLKSKRFVRTIALIYVHYSSAYIFHTRCVSVRNTLVCTCTRARLTPIPNHYHYSISISDRRIDSHTIFWPHISPLPVVRVSRTSQSYTQICWLRHPITSPAPPLRRRWSPSLSPRSSSSCPRCSAWWSPIRARDRRPIGSWHGCTPAGNRRPRFRECCSQRMPTPSGRHRRSKVRIQRRGRRKSRSFTTVHDITLTQQTIWDRITYSVWK